MHTRRLHALIRTPLSLLPEQERGNTRTHRTALLYDGQDCTNNTLSRSCFNVSLLLCQADTGRASPLDRLCGSKPRGNGSRLQSSPWLSHVTSIAKSKLSSQQWPCFKSIFVNMLGAQARATTSNDILFLIHNSHLASRCTPRVSKWKARKLLPTGTFVGIADTFSSTITHNRED